MLRVPGQGPSAACQLRSQIHEVSASSVRQCVDSARMTVSKRVWRSGVRFDCPDCGLLLKDDEAHALVLAGCCEACGGDLRLVGQGERMVENAQWFRCLGCEALYMKRRGEIVETKPRAGFVEFTEF